MSDTRYYRLAPVIRKPRKLFSTITDADVYITKLVKIYKLPGKYGHLCIEVRKLFTVSS